MLLPNQIILAKLPPGTVTAYIAGGRTRTTSGQVPHVTECITVERAHSPGWQLAPVAAADFALLVQDIIESGGEPPRLTDGFRPAAIQGPAREGFERWVAAGRPSPGSPQFHRSMKTAFVAPLDESNHQWGGSVDIDVGALYWPDLERGSNAALARFWTFAARRGWVPIISNPVVLQSESWHFDHLGSLKVVRDAFRKHKAHDAYAQTARAGCALAGTLLEHRRAQEKYLQARLQIAGHWCGAIDGLIGPATIAALKSAGCPVDLADACGQPGGLAAVGQWANEAALGSVEISKI